MIISIAEFVDDDMRKQLILSAKIREETLIRCYNMTGYRDLPLQEKNRIYDRVKADVIREFTEVKAI